MVTRRTLAPAIIVALCACSAVRAAAPPVDAGPAPFVRAVRVGGEGRVSVRPDVGILHVGVEATGKALAPVVADASGRMRRVLDALTELGVAEKDVQTTRHDVQVERPWENGRPGGITGYTVSDEVRVTVRDLAKLPAVLDRVVAVGSNALRGLSFERDDPSPERREALARAVADARAKAEVMARAAGVVLGEVVAVEEGGGERPPIQLMKQRGVAAMAADGAAVAPGELELTAAVEVTFSIR
jgi:hypothetical protein